MNCPHCSTVNPDFADSCSHCGTPMPISDTATIRMVDVTALSVGSDFGTRYKIEALLGEGGMGRVYKALDKDLDRHVAIKVVRQGMMGDTEAINRFKQELLLASKISHKNILRIHDMGEVGEVKFITMAYVEGQDLHGILEATPKLPFDRVVSFSLQLADALAAAHAEGVVHRDLKPHNILVAKNDQIFVSDFGLAKSFEENAVGMTRTGAFLGTPRYMSPEQVEGKPADQRSDLYAYGLILYEMVTGDVPFTGESTLKVMYQRIQEKPKNPKTLAPELPNWFNAIIMRCLEKNPEMRYQTAYEILADLHASKSSGSISANRSSFSGSFSRGSNRTVQIQLPDFAERRWIWVAGGVLAVVTLVFAIPPVRNRILHHGAAGSASGSGISGVPPLSSGRYVAVLPLQILGDQSQIGYLAQGIEEALSSKLFQIQDVHVTSNDAADKVDQKLPLPKLAGDLGANMVVQGTIQSEGDKIRVTLHMQDVINAKQVWTQEFDGTTEDLFSLEDHIYSQLVSALNVSPTNEENAMAEARPTENVAAYDLYLRGRNALRGHDPKSLQSAMDFFDQALKADPTFALAYSGIADASLRMYATKKDPFWTQKALAAAQQAGQLNDKLPEVHTTLGSAYSATGRYSEAEAELKRALSLSPNSDVAYNLLAKTYLQSGNGAQAVEAYQKAIQLNPYYWANQNQLGKAYFQLGDYAKALAAFTQVTVLEPDIEVGYENIGNVYAQQGKYQECITYFQKALQIEPNFSVYSNLGTAYFFLKQYPDATQMFEKAVELNPNDTMTTVNLADAYRASGMKDKATATYQQAISLGYKALQTNPQDADTMTEMALSYAKTGDSANADSFIHRARGIDKDNVEYIYIEAQIDALLGRKAEGFKMLEEAFQKHYPAESAVGDPDLGNLQGDPQFASLVKKYAASKP